MSRLSHFRASVQGSEQVSEDFWKKPALCVQDMKCQQPSGVREGSTVKSALSGLLEQKSTEASLAQALDAENPILGFRLIPTTWGLLVLRCCFGSLYWGPICRAWGLQLHRVHTGLVA